MNESATASGAREEVERLAQEFVERRRRGERPSIEEYAAAYPALAAEIRELFTTLLMVEDLGANLTGTAVAAPAADPEPPPGLQQVGEYRILREIGRGGMGVVYEAEQASLGRRVALKVLPFHSLLDQKRLERFQQEARAAARLSHPNIVPVYGVGEHLGIHYYAMQFIPGQGLNRVIEEVRRLRAAGESDGDIADPSSSSSLAAGLGSGGARGSRERYFRNMARLARDAALALDYAHGEGILHRDVKPSNLLLDPTGRVWLTDFGLAKAEGSDELTKSGDFVGTLLYMAPERFQGWSDPRSDVYGLGITLHELLTLRPAFAERDRAHLLRKLAAEEPPAPRRLDRAIPRDLETVVLKAISKEPGLRYGSARAMALDLDRFLEGLPVEARRSHALARLGRWCVRNPLPAALAAMVFILLVVVAVSSSIHAVNLRGEQAGSQEKLRASRLAEAGALRASTNPGRRFAALDALRQAAQIRPDADLVNEAIACLALVDLRRLKTWDKQRDDTFAISPDGSLAVLAHPDGEIIVSEGSDGEELFRLPGPGFRAGHTWTRFSRDGKHLAVRYHGSGLRVEWQVWDLDRRLVCARVADGHLSNCADFAPDGRWVALGTAEQTLRLLDLATGSVLEELGRGWQVGLAAVHPGGRLIAFSSYAVDGAGTPGRTGKVHILDREGGSVIRSLAGIENEAGFRGVAWHPDGKTLAAASMDHLVYVWDAATGERSRVLQGHSAEVVGVAFNASGSLLVSGGWEPVVRFWDPGSDRPLNSLHNRKEYLGLLADRSRCWTASDEQGELWELTASPPAFTLLGHSRTSKGVALKHPLTVALAPGGRLAATGGSDGVRLWDLAARREVAHLQTGTVVTLLFDPAGSELYASGSQGLRLWPLRPIGEGGNLLAVGPARRLTQLDGWQQASLGDGGRKMLAAHGQNHAHLFAPREPERWIELIGPATTGSVALSRDGAWAAAASKNGAEVWLWDVRQAQPGSALEPVRRIPAPSATVRFHPAGTHLATSTRRDLTLWKLDDEEPAWRLERERGLKYPGYIAFDPDGKVLAANDNESRIWLLEAATGKKLCELQAPERLQLTGLALEGGRIAASTSARRLHVWDLNALAREIAGLGLYWKVPTAGPALEDLPPLRVTVIEGSIAVLRDEGGDLAPRQLFRPTRSVAFQPQLTSCTQIDEALATPSFLVPEGEVWKYFRGAAEPSSGMQWAAVDHNDGSWEEGRSRFTGEDLPEGAEGTFLADQVGHYTTLYARRTFEVADPTAISRLILAAEVKDGLIAYLNGEEIGRANAGQPGERLSSKSVSKRKDRGRVTDVFEIKTALLRPGKNVLAIQAFSYGLDARIHLLPVLAAVPVPDAERDRRRTENLLTGPDGGVEASLLAYREGRILQRGGSLAEALERFERASDLDRSSAEPLLRRVACHRALGELVRAEGVAREAIEQGEIPDDGRLWRAWHHAALLDLGRSPAEALASLPRDPRAIPGGAASSYRRLLEELAAHGAFRLNCGGAELEAAEGKRWSRDAFFLGGVPLDQGKAAEGKGTDGDHAFHVTERSFVATAPFRPGYSIPLPPGRYRVLLHFIERTHHWPGQRIFDVLLEGRAVLEGYDPLRIGFAVPDIRSFEVPVMDGTLELDFVAHWDHPRIAAIEVEAIGE